MEKWTPCFSLLNGVVTGFHIAPAPHGSVHPIVETPRLLAGQVEPRTPEQIKEHAHLIAAAPDMLDALKQVLEYADKSDCLTGRLSRLVDAAIAKAEGRS